MTKESLTESSWYLCSDGTPIEPLDILHLNFPNKGRNTTAWNVCFVPDHFKFPPLRNLLPNETEHIQPDDFVDCTVALFYLCILVTVGLIVSKYLWEWVDPQFAAVTPEHKKWYVVANMSKAFFLACMMFSSRYWIGTYFALIKDNFSGLEMKRTGILYISTDIVALYMVPKLPRSTIMHHVSTATLIMLVSMMNMTHNGWTGLLGVCKMALLYGIFSSVSFSVNAYLALRVVYPKAKWLGWLVTFSLWPYILLCAANWTIHVIWVVVIVTSWEISIYNILYLIAISAMVQDDIVLIKWLWKRGSPMASSHEGENGIAKKEN